MHSFSLRPWLFSLALPSVLGCGLVQVGSGATAPETSGASVAGGGAKGGGSIAAVYSSWNMDSCTHPSSCGQDFARAAGIAISDPYMDNPRAGASNPDAKWLPGWDTLPSDGSSASASDVLTALHLAAYRKAWSRACDARYQSVKREIDAREAQTRAGVSAANALPPYARLKALLGLPTRGEEGALPFGLGGDSSAYEAEVAIAGGFREARRSFVYVREGVGHHHAADVVPRWPAALERDAYCLWASKHGDEAGRLPVVPTYYDRERGAAAVRPLFSTERLRELDEAHAAARATAKSALELENAGPEVAKMAAPKIESFRRHGAGAVIVFTRHLSYDAGGTYCVNGYGLRVDCPSVPVVEDYATTVTFAEWPASVTLSKGDGVTFYGKETSSKRSGTDTHENWVTTVEGLHLVSYSHGGHETPLL